MSEFLAFSQEKCVDDYRVKIRVGVLTGEVDVPYKEGKERAAQADGREYPLPATNRRHCRCFGWRVGGSSQVLKNPENR